MSQSKLLSHLFNKEDGELGICPTTLFNLPQNWVICSEKGGSKNFAQVITILGNCIIID